MISIRRALPSCGASKVLDACLDPQRMDEVQKCLRRGVHSKGTLGSHCATSAWRIEQRCRHVSKEPYKPNVPRSKSSRASRPIAEVMRAYSGGVPLRCHAERKSASSRMSIVSCSRSGVLLPVAVRAKSGSTSTALHSICSDNKPNTYNFLSFWARIVE